MSDVFLSYSRDDQAVARRYASGLEKAGFSVWWDQTLRSGETYDEVTEQALRAAKAVVVLWSKTSIASRWVRAEATIADRNRTLVPVMIEACDRPVMFELTQTADLTGWQGEAADPRWQAFLDDIRRCIERAGDGGPSAAATASMRALPELAAASSRRRPALAVSIAVMLLSALIVGGWMYLRKDPKGASPTAAVPSQAALQSASVAVLPFANLTGDSSKEYFGDGMAEELINALAKVPGLKVASRTSSFAYKGRNADVRQIARDLAVATVLEGSVRSAGDRVRITAQLINADSGYHVWSETWDYDFKDIFALQDDLAGKIVAAFRKSTNAPLDFKSQGPPTQDVQAYSLYLQGVAGLASNSDAEGLRGIKALEEAVQRDPRFAQAWLMLSALRSSLNQPAGEIERDARRALELDPTLAPGARTMLAVVEARRGHWIEAEDLLQGITVEQSLGHEFFARPLVSRWPTGHLRAVIADFEEALRLAPAHHNFEFNLAFSYSAVGRYADAARFYNAAISQGVNAEGRRALQLAADIAISQGRFDDAAASMIRALPPRLQQAGAGQAVRTVHSAMGNAAERTGAIAAIQALMPRLLPAEWVVKVWGMAWYSQLGRPDLALALAEDLRLQFGDELPTNAWSWLWSDQMRAMRRDPGFSSLVSKLGMLPYWEKYGAPDGCELRGARLTCS